MKVKLKLKATIIHEVDILSYNVNTTEEMCKLNEEKIIDILEDFYEEVSVKVEEINYSYTRTI